MSYVNSDYHDMVVEIATPGVYDLKIKQNPVSPPKGWDYLLTEFKGSAECKSCSDYIVGC